MIKQVKTANLHNINVTANLHYKNNQCKTTNLHNTNKRRQNNLCDTKQRKSTNLPDKIYIRQLIYMIKTTASTNLHD